MLTALAAAAFAGVAAFVEGSARTPAIQASTYVLAWRLTLLVTGGRPNGRLVIVSLPLLGGLWIGEWWAVALATINLTLLSAVMLTIGHTRDYTGEPLTWRELFAVVLVEALLLAAGVGAVRLVG